MHRFKKISKTIPTYKDKTNRFSLGFSTGTGSDFGCFCCKTSVNARFVPRGPCVDENIIQINKKLKHFVKGKI